eukprot:scaffold425_cov175-Amphora_coffeaeformis.AAC.7
MLSGTTAYAQLPKSGLPCILGSDCAGIVMAISGNECKFQIDDYVVSRFELPGPIDGLGEYRKVKVGLPEICPSSILPEAACGLPASAMSANCKHIVRDYIQKGDRVLMIGGSGGVGTCGLQYAKLAGASFVAAVSTQLDLCKRLGADQVIDYRSNSKWWDIAEFQEHKFDVAIDLVNGDNWTVGGCSGKVIKPTGTMLPYYREWKQKWKSSQCGT